jgi:hypothetical protein
VGLMRQCSIVACVWRGVQGSFYASGGDFRPFGI